MLIYSFLFKHFALRLLFIIISALITKCDGTYDLYSTREKTYCPFVETVSFGSDIDIKCNSTYLIFNEINNNKLNWKFANRTSFCRQKDKQESFVNQCDITPIGSKYLQVPFRSIDHNEHACVYCRINYKPIAPEITVTQSDNGRHILYKFNITATGLAYDQSFEILWAKRASHQIQESFNYWFLQGCIDPTVEIFEDTGHTIIFTVDDIFISRVEFIIRYCNGICRNYRKCDQDEYLDEISYKTFQTPDSIEKLSCNYDCLNGIVNKAVTINNIIKENLISSTIQLSTEKQTIKNLILFLILGLLIALTFFMLGFFIIYKSKNLRTKSVYIRTSHVELNEHK